MAIEKVLYRASATATGGRDGRAVSSDKALDLKLSTPKELGGAGGAGAGRDAAGGGRAGVSAFVVQFGGDSVAPGSAF